MSSNESKTPASGPESTPQQQQLEPPKAGKEGTFTSGSFDGEVYPWETDPPSGVPLSTIPFRETRIYKLNIASGDPSLLDHAVYCVHRRQPHIRPEQYEVEATVDIHEP
ncbi:hypothetical protein BJ508DRAFT_313737 [Ascobolus immersus RN42]|uniref:Uncharacterized protein n=1 Tax=Ascobolus immersus RN42 TaxID=1160509 RepID=A0A3N4HKW4_ASCIM|nr:hypothetical protein BJ508DRAFT_313737 [Ascobolus immersus RN42]